MTQETTETKPKVGRTGGRQKGTPNRTTATAKENIIAVFTRLGSTAKMAAWAEENLTEFYRLYARLIPVDTQISTPEGKRIVIEGIEPRS